MKRLMKIVAVLVVAACVQSAYAGAFYAITNEIGYQGTVWNVTDGTGPWSTTSPRDGYLYTAVGVPGFGADYNYLMSNWSEDSTSNTNNSFIQLAETGNPSVTSASASWDATNTVFSMTVTGANAPYPWSRMWQPDNGVAWGVTFTDYTYSFTANFSTAATIDADGWLSNTVAPDTITGTFTGHFVVTYDVAKNPITNGDTYGFEIGFSKTMFTPLDTLDAYGNPTAVMNYFGVVPEPMTLALLGLGGLMLRRRIS
jgi:hypothetical protein